MLRSSRIRAALSALILAVAAGSAAFAQHVVQQPGGEPVRPIVPRPIPVRTFAPMATPTPKPSTGTQPGTAPQPQTQTQVPGMLIPKARRPFIPGAGIPLSALAPLPVKTSANTAYFGATGRRTMAATGADINYFADVFFNANCASVVGTQFPLGCDVYWQSTNLTAGDTYQDYYVDAGSTTATTVGATYAYNRNPLEDTPNLTTAGTYILGTYDVTKGKWVAVIYITASNSTSFGTFADSGAAVPKTQFVAANGTNVYANATGLTQGQSYVVYIETTSVNPSCVYVAPPGSVTANTLCDATTSSGIVAVVGAQSSAAITAVWPLSNATPTGTYAVVLFDLTTNTRIAMRQVSITKTGSTGAIALTPTAGNAALGANWPTPPPTPYSTAVKFAFDNTGETSDTGWTMAATGLSASKNYTFTVSDPIGSVVSGPTTITSSATGTAASTYTFGAGNTPSNYVGNVYTVQMYNQTTGAVDASQAFQIVGYNALTQFQDPSTMAMSTAMVLPQGSSVTDNLVFTNDGDTLFGNGNGDTLRGFAFNTGTNGLTINLTGTTTSCGATCTQETVSDTNGQSWTVQDKCYGGGSNAGCTITAYPAVNGQTLAMSAAITIPSVKFNNVPGNSGCQSGCTATTSILPTDGETWSNSGNSSATNTVYFTNASGKTWAGTASLTHIGYRDSSNNFYAGQETHGYNYNASNAIYTSSSPYTTPSGYADVWAITITNNASGGTANMTEFQAAMPVAYTPGGTNTIVSLDPSSPTTWNVVIPCPAAGSPSACFGLQTGRGNSGIPPGGSQTVYVDLTPPPPAAFSFTDWAFQAVVPTQFTMTPAGSFTGFVPQNTYDSTASAAYSLNGNLITPGFAPTSEGQNTNNSVTINVSNASTAQDPYPDYLDLITVDLPSANPFTNPSGMPAGWSLLGTSTPSAGVTRYWFGLCAGQFVTADGPVTNPPPVNPSVPSCGAATEASSMAPGQTFSVTGNLQTAASNITATMYAHGANVNGWSAAHTFNLNVTPISATAGFSTAGGYPTGTTVTSPNTPQIGADADTTYGNAFTYVIKNTSGAGNNITSATITVPGKDTSAVLPADGTAWTFTGAPTISGAAYGCTITSYTSATTAGANGAINIGGASCKITPGSALTVTFTAKAPYTVNDTYSFPAKVNGAVNASEQWSTDTIVQVILSASLSIAVNPANPGPGGSAPVVSCASCVFNTGTNTVDMGPVANLATVTGGDIVRVSVFTNAGSSVGWKLYVSTNNNPANTGAPTNELLTSIDNTHSAPTAGINFDQTAYAVVPTTNPGMLLMDTGTGHAAQRLPFDEIMNFRVSINGGPITPTTSVVTYTFISN